MVGVDIVDISRVAKANTKNAFINKVLTSAEIKYLQTKSTMANNAFSEYDCTLAGYWAAKEAVLKALEIGIVADLKQVEILHKPNGAPYVKLDDKFCKKYNIISDKNINISISHDAGSAICVCYIA